MYGAGWDKHSKPTKLTGVGNTELEQDFPTTAMSLGNDDYRIKLNTAIARG